NSAYAPSRIASKSDELAVRRYGGMHVLFRTRRTYDQLARARIHINQTQPEVLFGPNRRCHYKPFGIRRPGKRPVPWTARRIHIRYLSFCAAERRDNPNSTPTCISPPANCDPLAIRRPGRTVINVFAGSQPQGGR